MGEINHYMKIDEQREEKEVPDFGPMTNMTSNLKHKDHKRKSHHAHEFSFNLSGFTRREALDMVEDIVPSMMISMAVLSFIVFGLVTCFMMCTMKCVAKKCKVIELSQE